MDNKVYVLQVIAGLHAGGMESMIMNYLRNLDRDKIQMDFLVYSDRSHYDAEVESLGSKIYRVTSRRQNPLKNYREIDSFFDLHKEYKIVHIHQGITYFKPLISAYKHNIPVRIVHSHGIDINYRKKYKWFYQNYAMPNIKKWATHYFACSMSAASELFLPDIISQVYLQHNAVNTEKFIFNKEKRIEIRKKLGIGSQYVLGHVGRFHYQKNQEFLIDIFSSVLKKNKDSLLLLVGGGDDETKIKEKVSRLGLEKNVLFLGVRNDIPDLMQAMDIFVLPSLFEGLPVVGVEAQAAGLPCIFANTITTETAITENCEFLDLANPLDLWADKILSYRNFSRENMYDDIIKQGYDIKTEAKKIEKFYKDAEL